MAAKGSNMDLAATTKTSFITSAFAFLFVIYLFILEKERRE